MLTYQFCPDCRDERHFEQVGCPDGHGADCPDWVCAECGLVILVGVLAGGSSAPTSAPARRSAA